MKKERDNMKTKINILWCFEDTEFEDLQYEEARINAGLPANLSLRKEEISDITEEFGSIDEYLQETYNFEILSYEED